MVTAQIHLLTEKESIYHKFDELNDYALYTLMFVILSEGLPHIICCDDSSGSWEKSNQHKTLLHNIILPARMLIPNQERPG